MKNSKILALVLAFTLALALLAGCGGSASSAAPSSAAPADSASQADSSTSEDAGTGAIELTDMMGRSISLEGPAQKVVALTASDCEIIYALGAGERLVGRGEYCDYPAEVLEVEMVQSGDETNVEQIIALAPDVLFMSSMAQSPEQIEQLEAAGIAVIVSEAATISQVYESIALIGMALGADAEAGNLVAEMMAGFAAIEQAAPADGEAKTIYFEVSPLEWGLWTAGSGTFMDEIATMLGLENAFADVSGWAEISQEQVIERDPDYIVTITMYFGDGPLPVDEILARDGWQDMQAVQNKAVFNADGDQLSRPGPRLVEGAQSLHDFVYGSAT